jgi:hypothetical protein
VLGKNANERIKNATPTHNCGIGDIVTDDHWQYSR